jgi:hypothetical protein
MYDDDDADTDEAGTVVDPVSQISSCWSNASSIEARILAKSSSVASGSSDTISVMCSCFVTLAAGSMVAVDTPLPVELPLVFGRLRRRSFTGGALTGTEAMACTSGAATGMSPRIVPILL